MCCCVVLRQGLTDCGAAVAVGVGGLLRGTDSNEWLGGFTDRLLCSSTHPTLLPGTTDGVQPPPKQQVATVDHSKSFGT